MLTRSPRVPVKWPSEISLCDSTSSRDGGGDVTASGPTTGSVYAAAEQGNLSMMTSYLSGGGNVNKRSKVPLWPARGLLVEGDRVRAVVSLALALCLGHNVG